MAVNYQAILDKLLDRGYEATTRNVQNAMRVATQQGIVATRLQQLTEEADRLAEAGENMTADNPVLAAALDAVEDLATYNRTLISQAAARLQEQGVQAGQTAARQLSLPGISDEALARVGIRWNRADPEAVSQLLRIAQSSQFTDSLKKYGEFVPQTIRDIALRGIVQGRGPIAVARELRANVETIPIHHANQMMRTIQLESYRRATALSYQANREMIVGHRRVAALDGKACLSCISLHGEILRVDDVVTDHRNGRCTSIAIIRGLEHLSEMETGEQWFNRQSEAERLRIAGPGAFEALQSGKVQLRDFVSRYNDPVYGTMLKNASLKDVLSGTTRGATVSAPPVPRAGTMSALFTDKALNDPSFKSAIDLMDKVHGVTPHAGPPIDFKYNNKKSSEGLFRTAPGQTGVIEISKGATNRILTAIHETAHAMDWNIFGSSSRFLSRSAGKADHELTAWDKAIRASAARNGMIRVPVSGMQYAEYMLRNDEMWARSYTQYIATRTGNAELLAEIAATRDLKDSSGNPHWARNTYWADDDFAPIAEAFDALFRARGWLR